MTTTTAKTNHALTVYPDEQGVDTASPLKLAMWYRFLRPAQTPTEAVIMRKIAQRFKHTGGFTPKLARTIRW